MTQTGYANAIVDAMLGWLKGLAGWVLQLFNLSGGASPLKFLADNWLKLLVLLLIIGVAVDLLVWLIRWRPYWIWFRKKRVLINDADFFAHEAELDEGAGRRKAASKRNWVDHEYVVPSKVVPKPAPRPASKAKKEADLWAEPKDVFQDDLFNVNAKQKFSDKYEDEVFNVSNLPRPKKVERPAAKAKKKPVSAKTGSGKSGSGKAKKPRRKDDLFLEWKD